MHAGEESLSNQALDSLLGRALGIPYVHHSLANGTDNLAIRFVPFIPERAWPKTENGGPEPREAIVGNICDGLKVAIPISKVEKLLPDSVLQCSLPVVLWSACELKEQCLSED